jgi:hypothetical protein
LLVFVIVGLLYQIQKPVFFVRVRFVLDHHPKMMAILTCRNHLTYVNMTPAASLFSKNFYPIRYSQPASLGASRSLLRGAKIPTIFSFRQIFFLQETLKEN